MCLWLSGIVVRAGEVEVQAGMKAGVNFSTSTGADAGNDQSITGIIGGGFVSINLSKWISLQPEIIFSQKGSKFDARRVFVNSPTDSVIQDGTFTSKLPYVEFPLLLRFNIVNESDFLPSLFAGPSFGFRASPTIAFEGTLTDSSGTRPFETKESASDAIKGTDIGLVVGGSLAIESGGGLVFVEVRYTKGLNSYYVDEAEVELKNSVVSVMLGLSF
jgi:hypothetical protein